MQRMLHYGSEYNKFSEFEAVASYYYLAVYNFARLLILVRTSVLYARVTISNSKPRQFSLVQAAFSFLIFSS